MKTIQCLGKYNFNRFKIVAIVKITTITKNEHFTRNNYYPVVYDFNEKIFGIMDNNYNLNMFHYYCEDINSIFKFLINLKGCLFEVAYYIEYTICNSKMFGKGFKSTFDINWSLKDTVGKRVSKTGIALC